MRFFDTKEKFKKKHSKAANLKQNKIKKN